MTTDTILVTGGAGFIGSHTVDKLLLDGYKVRILDNLSTGNLNNLPINHPKLEIIEGDICNIDDCIKATNECNYIIHLAAQVSVIKTVENPKESFTTNLLGFVNILEAVRKSQESPTKTNKLIDGKTSAKPNDINRTKKKKIIFASSAAIYGDNQNLPLSENDVSDNQLSPYALEKLTAEKYLQLYRKLYGIKYTIFRYFNVYGTRQDPSSPYSGVISKFINFYRNNDDFEIYGDGNQTRDFINVKDIATANCLAINKGDNQIYNIATGIGSSLLDLVEIFKHASPKNNISVIHHDARIGDIQHSKALIDKAKKELEFTCKYDLSSIEKLFT